MLQKTGIDKEKIVLSFMLVRIFIVGFGTSFSNLVNHTKGYTLSSYGGAIG